MSKKTHLRGAGGQDRPPGRGRTTRAVHSSRPSHPRPDGADGADHGTRPEVHSLLHLGSARPPGGTAHPVGDPTYLAVARALTPTKWPSRHSVASSRSTLPLPIPNYSLPVWKCMNRNSDSSASPRRNTDGCSRRPQSPGKDSDGTSLHPRDRHLAEGSPPRTVHLMSERE